MSISFPCPTCSFQLTTQDEHAGRTANCPQCKTPVIVPSAGPTPPPVLAPQSDSAPPLVTQEQMIAATEMLKSLSTETKLWIAFGVSSFLAILGIVVSLKILIGISLPIALGCLVFAIRERDRSIGKKLIERSGQGDVQATYELGLWHMKGLWYLRKKDLDNAKRCLEEAVAFGHLKARCALVQCTANEKWSKFHTNCTDIFDSTKRGTLEDVKFFIERKRISINAKDKNGNTPLHFAAARNSDVEILKYLISRGGKINAKNNLGWTPLFLAAGNTESVSVLKYLISQGADVNMRDNNGNTSIFVTVSLNCTETLLNGLNYLISQGADVNAVNNNNETPLHHAARDNPHWAVPACLILQGADVCARDELGSTVLHYAACCNPNPDILKRFISLGVEVNARDASGSTPLRYADTEEKRRILLSAGARS